MKIDRIELVRPDADGNAGYSATPSGITTLAQHDVGVRVKIAAKRAFIVPWPNIARAWLSPEEEPEPTQEEAADLERKLGLVPGGAA